MEQKVIWTNGCFDVNKDKGPTRPVFSEDDRRFMVNSISYVDRTHIFDSTYELEQLIKKISPDIMVIGSDWKGKTVIGEEYAKELKFFNRIDRYSTTEILEWKNR